MTSCRQVVTGITLPCASLLGRGEKLGDRKQAPALRRKSRTSGVVPVQSRAKRSDDLLEPNVPSTRNPLDTSSIAQSLDGNRLKGSLHVPE